MTATVHPIRPNSHTHERLRRQRQEVKDRLVAKIGIDPDDAPLFDMELLALAMATCAWNEAIRPIGKPR